MDVKNKRVVITGAANGIGRAMAFAFHSAGAKSILVSDINENDAKTVSEKIKGSFIKTDVTKKPDIFNLLSKANEEFGGIDIFCSNVGVGDYEDFLKTTTDDWYQILNINLMSHIYITRKVLPNMLKQGSGYLVFTASAAGLLSMIGSASYSVTKHAVVSLAEWIKIMYGKFGIGVSCSCPMYVRTAMTEGMPNVPHNMIEPEVVAEEVLKAIEQEQFLVTPHPEVLDYLKYKVSDYDGWISDMQDIQEK